MYGDDHATPDGTCVRDYVHVADVADAHLSALRWLNSGGHHVVLNVGSGRGYSVLEVLEAAQRLSD
ncbi:NAD-dependent epimerase/dehydratase family protein, partial [Escherichia coli]|uniref:NAD-dependent epimerase/dehydratase family protein n=1 Tax=Escherichia coli TaxID=562 RepID=UPI0019536A01